MMYKGPLFFVAVAALLLQTTQGQQLPLPPAADPESCARVTNINDRLDCYPDPNASEDSCKARGCCWSPTDVGRPWCFYPLDFKPYNVTGSPCRADLARKYRSPFPGDIHVVHSEITLFGDNLVGLKVTDVNSDRFTPPYPKLNIPSNGSCTVREVQGKYSVKSNDGQNLISVTTADDFERVLFTVGLVDLIYTDQLIQFTVDLEQSTLYGVGEHRTRLALNQNWTKYALWNHDVGPRENTNLYGSHPFVLAVTESGDSLGIYFHNSNAMEVSIKPGTSVTFRTLGGIVELYFFFGETPADVIRDYTRFVGLPALPPYWALGFQLCRWGYNSANNTRAVWQRNRDAQIPFDVLWNDIDYMRDHNDFTVDTVNFAELDELVADVHAAGMRYVSMLDPGISGSEPAGTYPPYDDAVAMDTLVKDNEGNIFIGHVWNDADTVYPDFFHPRALEYWTKQLREFRDKIQFDALWIDMNEPSNFFNGLEKGCPNNSLENPPYVPPVDGGILQTKTLCMTAQHAAGSHYNLHNLYSISEADITKRAAEDIIGKRTFLISRSTFSGIGRYAGHWSGDDSSEWSEMAASVIELLTFSLYGVPFMGSDICGFGGETTRELCLRWTQLGSFYPFSRNHNTIGSRDQDPASFDAEFAAAVRDTLNIRYSILPHLYTLLYQATVRGDTVARPLFFEFPDDPNARTVDTAFLWGPSLYIVPVLQEGARTVEAYLPKGRWYDWYSELEVEGAGGVVTLDAPLERIPLLIRGGYVFPMQGVGATTTISRTESFMFGVAPDENGNASGTLFWDDGESIGTIESGKYGLLEFTSTSQKFTSTVKQWNDDVEAPVLGRVAFLGITSSPSNVTVNGGAAEFTWDHEVLEVLTPNLKINEPVTVTWT